MNIHEFQARQLLAQYGGVVRLEIPASKIAVALGLKGDSMAGATQEAVKAVRKQTI